MSEIAVYHDLRGRFGLSRDQETRETCLAFAISDSHSALIGEPWRPLSCEFLFYHAKRRDGTSAHCGTTIPAIREALEHDGQPAENEWPYIKILPNDLSNWKPPAGINTLYRHTSEFKNSSFSNIWDLIEADFPAVVAMTLSRGFYTPDVNGVVDIDEPPDPAIRHAVIAVATGDANRKKMLLVRNSWGETWGLSGYAWLSENYLAPRIIGSVTIN
jgi:hypothetical protein